MFLIIIPHYSPLFIIVRHFSLSFVIIFCHCLTAFIIEWFFVRCRKVSSCEQLSGITACRHADAWGVFEILGANATFTVGAASRDAGAWSVLEILGRIEEYLAVFGVSERWRVERPRNSEHK